MPRGRAHAVVAPVGGWNTRDALDIMKPEDAVTLDNWFPDEGKVVLRGGYASHATGVGAGDVPTIAEYHVGATRKMLAAGGGAIYDATSSGAASSLASGFSENRWQWVNFDAKTGFVNGTDAPQIYNGSTVGAMTVSGSGLTVADLVGVMAHSSRTYFFENDSQDFWYSAVNTLGGVLTKFPLSLIGNIGGNLVCMGSWNVQGGDDEWGGGGIAEDLAVFVMSSGDTVVYRGSNPGDAADWTLVGVYKTSAPLDVRAIARRGADLLFQTKEGVVSVAKLVQQGLVTDDGRITDKIEPTFQVAAIDYVSNAGWQLHVHPKGKYILANIPTSSTTFEQYAMNAQTGSWCRFTGMNSVCWGNYNDDIYFGGTDGKVYKADSGNQDAGSSIQGDAETAYSYFGDRGSLKRCAALRPSLAGTGGIAIAVAAQFDFQTRGAPTSEVTLTSATPNWENIDTNWEENTQNWEGSSKATVAKWMGANGIGYAVGSRLRVDTSEDIEWNTMTYQIESGAGMI